MACRLMPPAEPLRVFISYAHKDGTELAQQLQKDLAKNFDTWLDSHRLTAGDIWSRDIEAAIDRASVVVALLSAGSYLSDICRAEQQRALQKGKCVIPVRVQTDCDIPLYLQTRQWLDFSNPKLYIEVLPLLVYSIDRKSGVAVGRVAGPLQQRSRPARELRQPPRASRSPAQHALHRSRQPQYRSHCNAGHGRNRQDRSGASPLPRRGGAAGVPRRNLLVRHRQRVTARLSRAHQGRSRPRPLSRRLRRRSCLPCPIPRPAAQKGGAHRRG